MKKKKKTEKDLQEEMSTLLSGIDREKSFKKYETEAYKIFREKLEDEKTKVGASKDLKTAIGLFYAPLYFRSREEQAKHIFGLLDQFFSKENMGLGIPDIIHALNAYAMHLTGHLYGTGEALEKFRKRHGKEVRDIEKFLGECHDKIVREVKAENALANLDYG